jgi:PLP dependent protein
MNNQAESLISENLKRVFEKIENASVRAHRSAEEVKLVVVTKAQPASLVSSAIDAGAKMLGENYPEEADLKIKTLGKKAAGVEWHMIGHLQSRKVSIVVDHFDFLHSLDSLRLAEKLEKDLTSKNKTLSVLLEFNVGGEESKYGWVAGNQADWNALLPEIEKVLNLPHLRVVGCMAMPPLVEEIEETRQYFIKLRTLCEHLKKQLGNQSMQELSMGTSADFEIAIEEGATFVRVGQAILGLRTIR